MSAYIETPKGKQPIPADKLCLPSRALKIAMELTEARDEETLYSVFPYTYTNPNEQIVYEGKERWLEILPGNQTAGYLAKAQDDNPGGHWKFVDDNPEQAEWNPFPAPPKS